MIGSLRRKVFWSILLSAAGVLLAILLAINVLKLVQTASKAESILDSAMFLLSPERTPLLWEIHARHEGSPLTLEEVLEAAARGDAAVAALVDAVRKEGSK